MYVTSYKINNSYITYVIHDSDYDRENNYTYKKSAPKLEWKKGAKVSHYFYGVGKILDIAGNVVRVDFNKPKFLKRQKKIQVSFEYIVDPGEIDSLRLCV